MKDADEQIDTILGPKQQRLVCPEAGRHAAVPGEKRFCLRKRRFTRGFCGLVRTCEHSSPITQNSALSTSYPLIPVVAMPRIKVFCVKKNITIMGRQMSVLAAMRLVQSVPPDWDW